MKKSFLYVTAIYLLFLSLMGVLLCVATFADLDNLPSTDINPLYLLISWILPIVWLIATGIGLLLRKKWSRFSILTMSGCALLSGVIVCLVAVAMPFPESAVPGPPESAVRFAIILPAFILLIVLPIVYFVFFTRSSVKELFANRDLGENETERPVGISMLAILSLLGGVFLLISLCFPYSAITPLFGLHISGVFFGIYEAAAVIASLYIAYGFWKLKRAAWIAAIVFYGFSMLALAGDLLFLSDYDYYRIMFQYNTAYIYNPDLLRAGFAVGVLLSLGILLYIVTKRDVFTDNNPL